MANWDSQRRGEYPPYRFIMGVGFTASDEHSLRRSWSVSGLKVPLRFVKDGVAALAHLQAVEAMPIDTFQMPAVVLMDFEANCLTALDVVKYLRLRRAFHEVVIVLCASSWSPEMGKQGYALGVDCCADKGAAFGEVIRLLQRLEQYWFRASAILQAA